MQTSEAIDQIAAAVAAAQAEISTVKKDKKANAGKFGYTYASLATVLEAVSPALGKHQIALVQTIGQADKRCTITTRLLHSSGQWLEGDCVIPVDGGGAQAVGSAISYGRRYGLTALLGVATDDDDGAAAQKAAPRRANPKPPPEPPPPKLDTASGLIMAIQSAATRAELQDFTAKLQAIELPLPQREAARDAWVAADARLKEPPPPPPPPEDHNYGPPAWGEGPRPAEPFGFGGGKR